MGHVTISTHQPRQHLSRLGQFRLKDAARIRDLAIAEAHHRYAEEVRAILGQDRAATLAYRQGLPVRAVPAISNPFGHAIEWLGSLFITKPQDLLGGGE